VSHEEYTAEDLAQLRDTDLGDQQLIAMGEVAVWAARVERTLAIVVASLIGGTPDAGALVTNGLPFNRLLELGSQLATRRPEGDTVRKNIERLGAPMRLAMESRNHLLHGEWVPWSEGIAKATLTRTRGTKEREFSVRAVEDVANDLTNLANELFWLHLVASGQIRAGD